MGEFTCKRCGKEFDPDETLDAYDEIGYMLSVSKFNGNNPYQEKSYIVSLCGRCTLDLNDFMYGTKK